MDLVVLGEQSLFVVSEHGGAVRYQRRFDFSPSCILAYSLRTMGDDLFVAPGEDKSQIIDNALTKPYNKGGLQTPGFMSLVGSFEGYLNVYKDIKLAWTAKLQTQPIFVATASFQGKQGLIVTFSDSGLLQISYLGTDQISATEVGKLYQNEKDLDL